MTTPEEIPAAVFRPGDRVRLIDPIPTLSNSYEGTLSNTRKRFEQERSELMRFDSRNYRGIRGYVGTVLGVAYPQTGLEYLKIRLDKPAYELRGNNVFSYTEIIENPGLLIPFLKSDNKADWRKAITVD